MAGKKKYNILVVPPSSGETVQLNIPQFVVSLLGFALVCGVLLFGFLLLEYHRSNNETEQLQALKAENAFLQSRLAGMKSSMATFGQCLGEIEQTEKNIRMVFGLPEIDPAERALGIGGFPAADVDALNPYQRPPFAIEADLAHLLRQANFERVIHGSH